VAREAQGRATGSQEVNELVKRAADWAHEASVLIAVFALLDKVLRGDLTWAWTVVALAVSAFFFIGAVALDRYARS
jgi:hypothetical protein